MAIADDLSVSGVNNKDIRWTGGSTTYTVLELHRFLQDLSDNASSSGDNLHDIVSDTASDKSTDNIVTLLNGYNIDDTVSQHLYDGSISQDNGDTIYRGIVVSGVLDNPSPQIQIVQNNTLLTSFWGTGLNADSANNILLRVCIKTRDGGADIDGNRLRVQVRDWGYTYSEFSFTAGLGNSFPALFSSADLNNASLEATIATYTDISNSEGFQTIDLNNGSGPREYYSQWDLGTREINDLYERAKWIGRRGTSEAIHGINGELFRGITHSFGYDNEASGPFQEDEIVTFGNGATAAILALDDDGTTGNMYVQLLTGVAPADNDTITGGTSSATANIAGSVTQRTVPSVFIGQSTGTSIIGAYGIGIEAVDLTANDKLFDLSNTDQVPPNNVTYTVSGLSVGDDRVLVGPESGGTFQLDQLSAAAGNNSGNGTFVVNETIPGDTPSAGTIRVFDGTSYIRLPYTSFSGSTFTLSGTLPSNISSSANTFISYIDELAAATTATFTVVFSSSRDLFVRVRAGGVAPIKTFESPSTLGAGGGSISVIRQSDA